MPSQIQGFNKEGESKWFDGGQLPEGWSYDDPTLKAKEAIPEEAPLADGEAPEGEPEDDQPSRDPEAAE